MGQIRDFDFQAVIGVGGIGEEPESYGIDRKINWVGIGPKINTGVRGLRRAEIIEFEHFVLLDAAGPLLSDMAPNLARRIYSGSDYIMNSYSDVENAETNSIILWARAYQPDRQNLHNVFILSNLDRA
jgi:hypothetical protein